jgi:DHA1 family bicyclomycin/chloramphenicol resistance-like MFS transporter
VAARTTPGEHPTRRLVLAVGTVTALGPLSTDLYLPALPTIADHYGTPVGTAQLSLAAGFGGLALGQIVYGPLSDAKGRQHPLMAGIALFAAACAACALAPSILALIGLNFVQAFGSCAGIVISRAIVRDLYSGADAARFYSLLMLVFGVAPIVAPLVGGQLLAAGGWRAPFIALAALGALCLLIASRVPDTLPRDLRRRGGARDALGSYRHVLRNRLFRAYALGCGLSYVGLFAYITASPAVVIDQYGVSPQLFGFIFGANSIGLVGVAQLAGRLVGRVPPPQILRVAVSVQAVAAAAFCAVAATGAGGLAGILTPLFFVVASVGAVTPTSTALALTPFPERAGAASALMGTLQLGIGAGAGALVGFVGFSAATSLGLVIAIGCGLAALVVLLAAPRAARPAPGSPAAAPECCS